jgi:hypothetical protein
MGGGKIYKCRLRFDIKNNVNWTAKRMVSIDEE